MRELPPVIRTIPGILHEWWGAVRLAGNLRSMLRLLSDVILFRVLGLIDLPGKNKERQVTFRDGTRIVYRLNRGDIQSIREVWMDRVYRLPVPMRRGLLVDLGANIGLTSLWLARHYAPSRIIAVEPSPENARLVRRNLEINGLAARVIEAAVGPEDGTALFDTSSDSNLGQVGTRGKPVAMISMASLLHQHAGDEPVALMKMDIEGGEQALLTSHTEWLARIPAIVAEFHPDRVDYPGLIEGLEAAGFTYFSPKTSRDIPMDFFDRTAR